MKKNWLLLIFNLMLLGICSSTTTKASHLAAGEISYSYTGIPNTYLVKCKLYRDCNGIPAPTQIWLCYASDSCSFTGSINLFPILGTGNPIAASPCVASVAGGTTCVGGLGYGIQEYIYEGTLVLPFSCEDWKLSFLECCRNAISTIWTSPGMYLDLKLDNLHFPTNSSPVYTSIPVTERCINQQQNVNTASWDIDGDSLVFSLINVEDGTGMCPMLPINAIYSSPYSATNPLSTLNGTYIDPNTGVVSFTPILIQSAVIVIKCIEFDKVLQQVKSISKREMQVNIVSTCIADTLTFDSLQANGINIDVDGVLNTSCDDSTFYIHFNQSIQCNSIVPSDIRFRDDDGNNNPVISALAVNCSNGLTDSILVTLANPIAAGRSYVITKIGFDGNTFLSSCGSQIPELDTLFFNLSDSSIKYFEATAQVGCDFDSILFNCNQQFTCSSIANGSEFTLIDANGDTLPITGSSCTGQMPGGMLTDRLTIYVQGTTASASPIYLITKNGIDGNTFSNACHSFANENDTIGFVTIINNMTLNLGSDISTCSADCKPTLDAGAFPFEVSYQWALNGNALGQDTSIIEVPLQGTYSLNVYASASCQVTDTVVVNQFNSPILNLGQDTTFCNTNSSFMLHAGNSGSIFHWFLNGTILNNETNEQITPSTTGNYVVQVTDLNNCKASDTIQINISSGSYLNSTIIDTLSLNTDSILFCNGLNNPVLGLNSPSSNLVYTWSFNGTTFNTNYINIDSEGIVSLIITDSAGCTASDEILIIDGMCNINIPNVFTPNGDGLNEVFIISGLSGFQERKLTIYDRWGQEIYNNDDYKNDWDGGNLSNGIFSFLYTLELISNNHSITKSGTIQIIK